MLDLGHEDREELQLLQAEIDLRPERLKALLAELVLARKLVRWTGRHRDRLPAELRLVQAALAHRPEIARLAADSRAELEG